MKAERKRLGRERSKDVVSGKVLSYMILGVLWRISYTIALLIVPTPAQFRWGKKNGTYEP